MASRTFGTVLITLGLVAGGGILYYLATKKEGGTGIELPSLDVQGIIDYINGLIAQLGAGAGGGGGNGGGNGGGGDGGGNGGGDGGGDGGGGGTTAKIVPSQTSIKKGGNVSIQCTGFGATEVIDFTAKIGSTVVGTDNKTTDANGSIQLDDMDGLNTAPTGTVIITAKGKTSGKTATATVTITADTTTGGGGGGGGGTTATGSVVFGAAGDFGSGRNSNYKKTVDAMKNAGVQTMLGLGDYSYTNVSDAKKITDYAKSKGIVSKGAEGNHDSSSYTSIFQSQSSMLYSFNQGPAVVIILNTESSASGNAAFAEKVLKSTNQAWRILIMHKPLYTNSSDHGAESGLANALKPIINKYGVQLVLMAHNHNFQRMVISGYSKTVFVVSGTGGESHYNLKASQSGTKYMNDSDFGFTKIAINGNKLTGQFITTGGSVKHSWSQTLGATASLAYVRALPTYPYLNPYRRFIEEPIGMRISI